MFSCDLIVCFPAVISKKIKITNKINVRKKCRGHNGVVGVEGSNPSVPTNDKASRVNVHQHDKNKTITKQ